MIKGGVIRCSTPQELCTYADRLGAEGYAVALNFKELTLTVLDARQGPKAPEEPAEPEAPVRLSTHDFGLLTVCAERYAIGRRDSSPWAVCNIIRRHIDDIGDRDVSVLKNDISYPDRGYGDLCDAAEWAQTLDMLRAEASKRAKRRKEESRHDDK